MSSLPKSGDRIAYLGRVSSPKQKLEHQREGVLKFASDNGIHLPPEMWFEDKVRRHKQLTEGKNFGRLMQLAVAGQIDWILIATFDRWGITDKDDIFVFRKQLRPMGVRLWSVADELEITGSDDSSFWRVAARAEAATGYVSQQAQKNIQKMLSMAKLGLAGSGNAPFAVDLVCYPLIGGHAPDLTKPMFRVVRMRYIRPAIYKVIYYNDCQVEREESTEKMPLRDKKATAYRYEPCQDLHRLRAVKLIYELYDSGMNFGQVSETLWKQGFTHYDKPFGFHGVESILRNPVYIGRPAWGKSGVGTYYLSMDGQAVKAQRKTKDPFAIKKGREHFTQPPAPLWEPIVPVDLWERVQARLDDRPKSDPAFGMRRQRSQVLHPLNGKVICPDCGNPMVMGASQSKGYIKRYFVCGLYRRTIRKQCRPNSVPFDTIDAATDLLLAKVRGRIDALTAPAIPPSVLQEQWAKETELGRIIARIAERYYADQLGDPVVVTEDHSRLIRMQGEDGLLPFAFEHYNRQFEEASKGLRTELCAIDAELERIAASIMDGIPSQTVRQRLNARMAELEARKRELQPQLTPLTATASDLIDQLKAIRATIESSDITSRAQLLDAFIEKVVPRFEGEPVRGHGRTVGFEFVPRVTAHDFMPQPLKLGDARRGRGSSRRRG